MGIISGPSGKRQKKARNVTQEHTHTATRGISQPIASHRISSDFRVSFLSPAHTTQQVFTSFFKQLLYQSSICSFHLCIFFAFIWDLNSTPASSASHFKQKPANNTPRSLVAHIYLQQNQDDLYTKRCPFCCFASCCRTSSHCQHTCFCSSVPASRARMVSCF